jgi:hypothetical protein
VPPLGGDHTLIEHWNGTRWAQVPSPDPGGPVTGNQLSGVAGTSPTSIWAVGHTSSQALALHCC